MRNNIIDLLGDIYSAHEYYQKLNNLGRIKIAETCSPLFDELETLGVSRAFSEAFLVFGDDFLVSEHGVRWVNVVKSG